MNTIPERKDIPACDKWDLTSLYKSDADWEADLLRINELADKIVAYQGKLKSSAEDMLELLKLNQEMEQISERTGNYAFLQTASDASDASFQDKEGRYMMAAVEAESKTCFIVTEIQEIPDEEMARRLERSDYADYKIMLQKILHNKPHILSEKEEKLFAMMSESQQTPHNAFSMLTNVDMNFGSVNGKPLSQSTYSVFMENPDRAIRKEAYEKFYGTFDAHKNTLATLYAGNVQQDVFEAKARGYKSSLEMALYPDNVPLSVYTNLVKTVRENLAPLHKYYQIRKRALKLDELRHYDVYAPLVDEVKTKTSYNQAVEIVREALSPLGKDYTDILCGGLLGGWVDKYENKGKRSGAFSSGGYTGYPYIMLNYKDDALRDVFTMIHEGGHSMHSWFSAHNNPFCCYNYTIFEAEVASTFNEELLFQYLIKNTSDEKMKAYLICSRAADIMATLHRQTMFAEFELKAHELVESGTPLSLEVLRSEYRKLLQAYFGPEMVFEETSDLEGLRIPHFYNSFYVYKYSTGISASLALSERVLKGGKNELDDYFKFLKSGGSRYPIDSLKVAGVDMSSPEPIKAALKKFEELVNQMDAMF
ncbi:MAG: oligoendopeptidase F [Treponemataceae bacterium]|nr:oligoendopeptidase F [Treponemataceae bacterium]